MREQQYMDLALLNNVSSGMDGLNSWLVRTRSSWSETFPECIRDVVLYEKCLFQKKKKKLCLQCHLSLEDFPLNFIETMRISKIHFLKIKN